MVSVICESFGALPQAGGVEDQGWSLVSAVLDYRNAVAARDLMNQGSRGFEELTKQPALQRILLRMHRAQSDEPITLEAVMADAAERAREVDERTEEDDG